MGMYRWRMQKQTTGPSNWDTSIHWKAQSITWTSKEKHQQTRHSWRIIPEQIMNTAKPSNDWKRGKALNRYSSKESLQVDSRHHQSANYVSIIQIKSTVRITSYPWECSLLKDTYTWRVRHVGKNIESWKELPGTVGNRKEMSPWLFP